MKVVNDFDNHKSVSKLADAHGVSKSAALDWIRLYREKLLTEELEFSPLIPEPMKGNTLGAYSIILDNLKSKRESAIDMAEKAKKEMEILQRAEGVAKELKEIDSAFDFVLMKRDR